MGVAQHQYVTVLGIETLEGVAHDPNEFMGADQPLRGRRHAQRFVPLSGLCQGIHRKYFSTRLQTAQALPNESRNHGPQVGVQGMLTPPLAQYAEIMRPQTDINLLREIIDKLSGLVGRAKNHVPEKGVETLDETL